MGTDLGVQASPGNGYSEPYTSLTKWPQNLPQKVSEGKRSEALLYGSMTEWNDVVFLYVGTVGIWGRTILHCAGSPKRDRILRCLWPSSPNASVPRSHHD